MNVYFDTEFTGLVPGTTLISLGMVTEKGDKFYAEFTDFDRSKVTDWIKENVIENLRAKRQIESVKDNTAIYEPSDELFPYDFVLGDTEFIKDKLIEWLKWHAHELPNEKSQRVQFVSDVCHYDMYLLQNQIFGGAFEMPDWINPVCYDIVWDIEEFECMGVGNNFNTTKNMYTAFDISREKLIESKKDMKLPDGLKHNALYDAEVIKVLYEYCYNKRFHARKFYTMRYLQEGRGCRDYFDTWYEDEKYLKAALDWDTKAYLKEIEEQ